MKKQKHETLDDVFGAQSEETLRGFSRPFYPLWLGSEERLYFFPSKGDWCQKHEVSSLYLVIKPNSLPLEQGQYDHATQPIQKIQKRLQKALPELEGSDAEFTSQEDHDGGMHPSSHQTITMPLVLQSGRLSPFSVAISSAMAKRGFACELVGHSRKGQWLQLDRFFFSRTFQLRADARSHTLLFHFHGYSKKASSQAELEQEDFVLLGAVPNGVMQTSGTLLHHAKKLYGRDKEQKGGLFLAQSVIEGVWQEAQWLHPQLSMHMSVVDAYQRPSFQPKHHADFLPKSGEIASSQIAIQGVQAPQLDQAGLTLYLGSGEDDHDWALRSLYGFHWCGAKQKNAMAYRGENEAINNPLALHSLYELGTAIEKDGHFYFHYAPDELLVGDIIGIGVFEPFYDVRFMWQQAKTAEEQKLSFLSYGMSSFVYTGAQLAIIDAGAQTHVANRESLAKFESALSDHLSGLGLNKQGDRAIWRRLYLHAKWPTNNKDTQGDVPRHQLLEKGDIHPLALACLPPNEEDMSLLKQYVKQPFLTIFAHNKERLFGGDSKAFQTLFHEAKSGFVPLALFLEHKGFDQGQVEWALQHAPINQIMIWQMAIENVAVLGPLLAHNILIDHAMVAAPPIQSELIHAMKVVQEMNEWQLTHLEALIKADMVHWPQSKETLEALAHWRVSKSVVGSKNGQVKKPLTFTRLRLLTSGVDHAHALWHGWWVKLRPAMKAIVSPRIPQKPLFERASEMGDTDDLVFNKDQLRKQLTQMAQEEESLAPHFNELLQHIEGISDPLFLAHLGEQFTQEQSYRGSLRAQFNLMLNELDITQDQLALLSGAKIKPEDWIAQSSLSLQKTYQQDLFDFQNLLDEKKTALFHQLSLAQRELIDANFDEMFAPLRRAAPMIVWMRLKDRVDEQASQLTQTMGEVLRGLSSAQSRGTDIRHSMVRFAEDYGALNHAGRHTLDERRKLLDKIEQLVSEVS